jgi:hypothetical protein
VAEASWKVSEEPINTDIVEQVVVLGIGAERGLREHDVRRAPGSIGGVHNGATVFPVSTFFSADASFTLSPFMLQMCFLSCSFLTISYLCSVPPNNYKGTSNYSIQYRAENSHQERPR